MPLTAEERSAVNRRNASRSTGPRTDEGKAASRRNATKHGLRAEALALPNEDPTVAAARSDSWNDYYQPQSPAAQHLVNACVAATLLADRCNTYHTAAVARQVREAEHDWYTDRDKAVADRVGWLRTAPAVAVRELSETAHGCRWQIDRWEELIAALDGRGQWTGPERDDAIRLQGLRPEVDQLKECPAAWLTRLFALLCEAVPNAPALQWMFLSHVCPDLYWGDYRIDSVPLAEDCRADLRRMAVDRLALLQTMEKLFRENYEEPDCDEAAARALILHDGPSARLFLRYHAEARTAFHRAYGSLVKALALDAAEADTESEAPAVSPNEANPAPAPAPPEAVSPNEADSAGNPQNLSTSAESGGHGPTALASSLAADFQAVPTAQAGRDGATPVLTRRVA